jgi:hypothetical protein
VRLQNFFCGTYGATLVAGSLHGPWPAVPMAAARSQYFVPLVRPDIVAFERVTMSASYQPVAVIGSRLFSIRYDFAPIGTRIAAIRVKIAAIRVKNAAIRVKIAVIRVQTAAIRVKTAVIQVKTAAIRIKTAVI